MGEHDDLLSVGFERSSDGTLRAPAASRVKLVPMGQFYELRISLGDGNAIVAVLSKSAVKVCREEATSEPVDVSTLIVPTTTRRPW